MMCDNGKFLEAVVNMTSLMIVKFEQLDERLDTMRDVLKSTLDKVAETVHQRELQAQDVFIAINGLSDRIADVFKFLSEHPEAVEKLNDECMVVEKVKTPYDPSS